MRIGFLLVLGLVALALWALGLVSPQMLFAFAQVLFAAATVLFLIQFVRRRRDQRGPARGHRHAP